MLDKIDKSGINSNKYNKTNSSRIAAIIDKIIIRILYTDIIKIVNNTI